LADAKRTKNGKPARQYIQPDLAIELQNHIAKKLGGAAVFSMPHACTVADMFREDLAAARSAWLDSITNPQAKIEAEASDFLTVIDSEKEHLDFHALRHTTASWLIQSGADVKTVQTILRQYQAHARSLRAFVPRLRSRCRLPAGVYLSTPRGSRCYWNLPNQSAARGGAFATRTERVRNLANPCENAKPVSRMPRRQKPNKKAANSNEMPLLVLMRAEGLEPSTQGLKE
jgi:Phage integrase family